MRYTEISRRRAVSQPATKPFSIKADREVVRFKIGTIYKIDGEKFVCVDRYTDNGGAHIGMVSLSEVKGDKRDEYGSLEYQSDREAGCACHDEYLIRTHNGVEYAIEENHIDIIDGDKEAHGGRFNIDCGGHLESVPDVAICRADRTYGTESLEMPEKTKPKKSRKTKNNGNPIAGIVTIAAILLIIKACCAI